MRKWIVIVITLLLLIGGYYLLASPTVEATYQPPMDTGGLFDVVTPIEQGELLAAALKHVRQNHDSPLIRPFAGRWIHTRDKGVLVRDTKEMHLRYRAYLDSFGEKGAVEQLKSLPPEFKVTVRLHLVSPGQQHREMLNREDRLTQLADQIKSKILSPKDKLTQFPGQGVIEICTSAQQVLDVGALLDSIPPSVPRYSSLASLYKEDTAAYCFERAIELSKMPPLFWKNDDFPHLVDKLNKGMQFDESDWDAHKHLTANCGRQIYLLRKGLDTFDYAYKTLPCRDPFQVWKPNQRPIQLAYLIWKEGLKQSHADKISEGISLASVIIFWADRLERGESPYWPLTPEMREMGCRAIAGLVSHATDPLDAGILKTAQGLLAARRLTPFREPWPRSRYFDADTNDPLERWVNGWREEREQAFWERWKMSQTVANLLELEFALRRFRIDNPEYPGSLKELVSEKYIRTIPRDLLTNKPYIYETDGLVYRLYTPGYDGQDNGRKQRCNTEDISSPGDWWWNLWEQDSQQKADQ
jgi:hypothetical protein